MMRLVDSQVGEQVVVGKRYLIKYNKYYRQINYAVAICQPGKAYQTYFKEGDVVDWNDLRWWFEDSIYGFQIYPADVVEIAELRSD